MTTDSAANFVAGVRELKKNQGLSILIHLRCSAHVINLIVEAGIKIFEKEFDKIRYFCKKVNLKLLYR